MTGKPANQKLINIAMIVAVLGVFGIVATVYLSQCEAGRCPSPEAFVESFGPWAPLIYAVLYIAGSPIPYLATVLSATSGLLFGAVPGTLYTIFVATISALVPFTIARRLGREWIESKLKGKRLGAYYVQSDSGRGFAFVLLMRLIPVLPWEIQNYVAGLTKVPIPTFLLATIIGIIPGTFSLAFLGDSIGDPSAWQFWAAVALNVTTGIIPVFVIYMRNRAKETVP